MRRALLISVVLTALAAILAFASAPTTLNDFFMPGSQPGESGNLEHPDKCDNCHGGYDTAVEPAFNWRGSMMSQAARDPLFYACMAIANQDAPESGDLCIRCHSPAGWLEGRSVPTDGSALNNNDREGVQCDFCHKLVKPTALGTNPYPNDPDYTAGTYDADQAYLATITEIPPTSANGMYICDANNAKRGPFVDAAARHQMYYSPFHKDAGLCGTCHDVSNPAYNRNADDTYSPNAFDAPAPDFDPYAMFPVERTYSEWLFSEYNTTQGVYAPQFGGNKSYVSTCQDCHMRDVTGFGCNKKGAPSRDDLPLHDMTGGNTFIPQMLDALWPGEVNQAALDAGVQRATEMLQQAATMALTVTPSGTGYDANVHVVNETGHKLPSGYPEGRRIWINLVAYDGNGQTIYESGAYDFATAELTHDADAKIYEIKPGISSDIAPVLNLPAGIGFHFVVNNQIFKDNRIPPRGFTNANYEMIQSPPVGYTYTDGQYWDDTQYPIPANAARIVATLFYQTISKEYVEFLRDNNVTNDWGTRFYNAWVGAGMSAPVAMATDTVDLAPIGNAPAADFVGTPTTGTIPFTVDFTDLSSGSPTTWAWNFGDGGTSSAQNPSHTYTSAGVYDVILTVTNADGSDSETKQGYITADPPAGQTFVHVANVTVTSATAKGNRVYGVASVKVVDQGGLPIAGLTVTGDFTQPITQTVSATTDANGIALLESRSERNPATEFCFSVTDVTGTGVSYDPSANVVTSACESGPTAKFANGDLPEGFELGQNYPNPFNPTTVIEFSIPTTSQVSLIVYNVVGQKVTTLVNQTLDAGAHSVEWDASAMPSGVYLYQLQFGDNTISKKMVLAK
jgi:PKD repeat protein